MALNVQVEQSITKARKLKGWFTYALALCLVNITVFSYISIDTDYKFMGVIIGIILLIITISFFVIAESLLMPSANEVLTRDHRSPVIYLRPFTIDLHHISDRVDPYLSQSGMDDTPIEDLLKPLNAIGPVISIADPNASAIHTFGTYREDLDTDNWKTRVIALLEQANLVVLVCGNTPGIEWEIQQIKKFVPLTSLLLFIPPLSGSYGRQKDWQEVEKKQYDEFRSMFSLNLGVNLPIYSRSNYFIGFDSNNKIILPFDKEPIDHSINDKSYIAGIAQNQLYKILGQIRPDVSLRKYPIYGQLSRRLRFAFSMLTFIFSIPLSVYLIY